jgi:hypothetical protein
MDLSSRSAASLVRTMAGSMLGIGSVNLLPFSGLGPMLLVLSPDHARTLARAGFTKQGFKEALCEATRGIPLSAWPEEYRDQLVESGRVVDGMTPLAHRPDQFEVVVAGGEGGFCSVFLPTFGDSYTVTRTVLE